VQPRAWHREQADLRDLLGEPHRLPQRRTARKALDWADLAQCEAKRAGKNRRRVA